MDDQLETAEPPPSAAEGAPLEELTADPTAPQSLAERGWELLQAGGPVVAILLVLSILALAIVLIKLWQFRAARVGARRHARQALRLWQEGRAEEAQQLADRARGPLAQAMARAMRGQRRGLPEARVRDEVLRYGGEALSALRAWFRPLEVIASLAPLLGLFGTVLGMIDAFRQLEAAGNQVNPAILSGGIWVALLTTAVGLAVAIPVVAVLNWLERRVERLAEEMDSLVTQVFTEDLSAQAAERTLAGRPAPARLHSGAMAGA
ncbi:MAG: MotA/TolQ/ExbB proton channel family protein [Rhodovibrionaceae bacterium]